jgi:Ion channel
MMILGVLTGALLILVVLADGFESMVLPRQVMRRYRFARLFYRNLWNLWRWVALRLPAGKRREAFLSVFGPLSLLGLFASWVLVLIIGFALVHWSLGSPLTTDKQPRSFGTYLYWSGATFVTISYGDLVPMSRAAKVLAITESGLGFGFLAVIIGYLPVLYQAFSRREVTISLLDARAGSPPSAAEFLLRLAQANNMAAAEGFFAEWERWSGELLESHLSYPVLSYYRSQHDNQSWLAVLTMVLDAAAIVIVGRKGREAYQAQLTFAMARHTAVDLALVFRIRPRSPDVDRLPPEDLERLRERLCSAGVDFGQGTDGAKRLAELRGMYEPFVHTLANHFLLALPMIVPPQPVADNWQRSAWQPRAPGIGQLPGEKVQDEHFR